MSTPAFHVGPIAVPGDLILSPMDGFSDLPFRLICRELGSSMSYTEFVNVDEISSSRRRDTRAWKKLAYHPTEHPTMVYQLYGHDVDRLTAVACRVVDEGRPDILDINMGCYVRSVSERGAGSGMLPPPGRIARLFSRLTESLSIPVTAKIRLGWDEGHRNYLEVARVLEDGGAALIAVHGRTQAQQYRGEADWAAIGEIKAAVKIPVAGNGDVKTVADIERMKRQTGCDAVMIGRAAVGNPWIFQRKDREQVTLADKIALVRRHLAENIEYYGPEIGLILFRKHVVKYIQGLPGEADMRIPLLTCRRAEEFVEVIQQATFTASAG
ncbi:MAG: tRNA-dihydrouridine synthase [Chloroflexi bacterium]|nr:tRNA-dihydrouridine synthase [Chloroflexota bacterium]